MITIAPRPHSGIFLESTNVEALGVLPGEDRLVKDVMNREVAPIDVFSSVKEAVEMLWNWNRHIVIVCRENEPISALTEYDMAISGADNEDHSCSITLHDIVKKRTEIRCHEDAILADAIRAMAARRTRHVPVVNAQGSLVGALSLMKAVEALPPDVAADWLKKIRQLPAEASQFE